MVIPHLFVHSNVGECLVDSNLQLLQSFSYIRAVGAIINMPLCGHLFSFIRIMLRSKMAVLLQWGVYINQVSINLLNIRSYSSHLKSKRKLPPLRPKKKK